MSITITITRPRLSARTVLAFVEKIMQGQPQFINAKIEVSKGDLLPLAPRRVLFTDSQGRDYHVIERGDGSISFYYTRFDSPAHFVLYDSLDTEDQK